MENEKKNGFTEVFEGTNGKKGVRLTEGKVVVPAVFDDIACTYREALLGKQPYVAINDGKYGLVSPDGLGTVLAPFDYDDIALPAENPRFFLYKKDGSQKFGLLDASDGSELTPCNLDTYSCEGETVYFTSNGKQGLWQSYIDELLDPIYDDIEVNECFEPTVFTLNGVKGYVKVLEQTFIPQSEESTMDPDAWSDLLLECICDEYFFGDYYTPDYCERHNLHESIGGLKLMESFNLSRIEKHGKDGFVVVSANRSDIVSNDERLSLASEYKRWLKRNNIEPSEKNETIFLSKRNKEAVDELMKDIKDKGYSYSLVYGGYHGTDDVKDSFEPSVVIYNHKRTSEVCDFSELKAFAIELCRKYQQDVVYVQEPDMAPNFLNSDGEILNKPSSKNFKFNRDDEEYFTTTKREKRNPQKFTADIFFEGMYYKPALKHEYVDRMRRSQYGEIFLG